MDTTDATSASFSIDDDSMTWVSDSTFKNDQEWAANLFNVRSDKVPEQETHLTNQKHQTDHKIMEFIKVPLNKIIPVYISNVVSPSRFWLQLNRDKAQDIDFKLEETQKLLLKDAKSMVTGVKVNSYVAARYMKDEMWYRATIIQMIEVDGKKMFEVYFIDYGNIEFVDESNISDLPEELLHIEAQAVPCCLNCVDITKQWNDEIANKFTSSLFDAQVLFACFFQPLLDECKRPTYTVELLLDSKLQNCIELLPVLEIRPEIESNKKNEGMKRKVQKFLCARIPSQ